MRRGLKFFYCMFLSITCTFSAILPVTAQDTAETSPVAHDVALGLYPAGGIDGDRFEFTIEPGQSDEMTAVLMNAGPEPLRLRSFASHIIPVPNGGMQVPDHGTEPEGTVSWIDYPDEEITLQPDEQVERVIRVTVPEGTPPGQYVNAVALATLDPIITEGSPFAQYYRKVVSVYVTVPGDVVTDFSFDEYKVLVNRGRSAMQFSVHNNGNTRIDLSGTVSLSDRSGTVIHEGSVLLGPIYMGQSTIVQVLLPIVPAPGDDYTVSFSLTDKNSAETVSENQIAVSVGEDADPGDEEPLRFTNVSVEANAEPIVFANVSVDIESTQSSFRSTTLTLSVFLDGVLLEEFVMAENLSLEIGSTTVSQRYLPASNWEPGTYTFSLKLESTSDGQTALLLEQPDVATLEVP